MTSTYSPTSLIQFATKLLSRAGLKEDRARVVAETLVESDLMGHTTHGLQLLPAYLKEVSAGKMKWDGDPIVISDKGSDRKSTRLNSSHVKISYAVFCLKKKKIRTANRQ